MGKNWTVKKNYDIGGMGRAVGKVISLCNAGKNQVNKYQFFALV